MRLLVYGGTLYAERRRIGEWPASVSPQFLQSTAGLSELRPTYGVGILDESQFVIFRMMLMHERRSYPFTVLLDPGECWADFGWNGARLLWLLFDRAADKGSALIKEPESFQTAADLNALLLQVLKEDATPPEPEDEAAARADEQFLNLWTGALAHEGPLVLGFGDAELGLAESPRDAEMTRRLELLPPSLRGALGWVMGGKEEYAAALGTRLILDNSRAAEANAAEGARDLVGSGHVWLSDWREVEGRVRTRPGDEEGDKRSRGRSVEDETLKDLFSKPLAVWEREQRGRFPAYTTRDLLEDVSCIRRLLPPAGGEGDDGGAASAPSEHLRGVLEGRHRGPFNTTIEGLYEYLSSFSVRPLDADSTRHYLRKLYDRGGELEVEESRLHREAAIAFTVERGLYPSDGPVPESIRFEVLKQLLQREGKSEEIRRRLLAEWPRLNAEEGRELREVALERSAELPEGMNCWAPHLKKPPSLELASAVVWRHAGEGRAAWNTDYLMFGNDPGGARLLELHPGLVEGVVSKALRALDDDPGAAELRACSLDWLVAAGRTELRRSLSIETKKYLADKGLGNWHGLLYLKRAFHEPAGAASAADPEEQQYLAGELRELSGHLTDGARAPFLLDIVRLFDLARVTEANVGMREALDRLASLKPDLTGEAGESWVRGWREIAEGEVITTHGRRYRHKFREAAALYLAQSDRVEPIVKLKELSEEGAEDPLKDLLVHLLFEGEGEKAKLYGRKLNAVRAEIVEKDETVRRALQAVLRQAVEEGRSLHGLFRRLAPYDKTLDAIRQALPEQQAQLEAAEQKFRDSTLDDYRRQIFELLSGRRGGAANADEFSDLKKNLMAGGSNNAELFRKALSLAVTDLLDSPSQAATFLGRFADRAKTIKEIKDNLPIDATTQALDDAIVKYRKTKLRQEFETLLCGGDGAALSERLAREKKPEVVTDAADAAMVNCLEDSWKWGRLYDGMMVELTRDGVRRLRLSPKEAFVKFFGYLSPDVQQEVLRRAFHENKDRFHQMVVRAYEQRKKYDKTFKEKKPVEVNAMRDAVLAFLTEPEGREGYVAMIKLLPSTGLNRPKLDKYLAKFRSLRPADPKANGQPPAEPDKPVPAPAEPEKGPALKQGWWGRLIPSRKPGGQS